MRVRAIATLVVAFTCFGAFGILAADAANPAGFTPVVNSLSQLNAPAVLYGTSCPSSSQCVAVGFDIGIQPIVLSGDPSSWGVGQIQQFSLGDTARYSRLFSVDCATPTSCVAVGRADGEALVLAGDPATWGPAQAKLIDLGPSFGFFSSLYAVKCTSSSSCVAVGDDGNGMPIVLAGDPATWGAAQAHEITLGPGHGGGAYLGAVTCTSASSCVAVGADYNGMPFVVAGDPTTVGAAQAQTITLDASFGSGGELNSVSCTSATACLAVGDDFNGQPLTLAGDPSSWGIAQTNEIALSGLGGGGALFSVTCTSSSSCVAVGIDQNLQPLVFSGDPSTTWTEAQAQEIFLGASFGAHGELAAISCASASTCVATGIDGNNEPLILSGDPSTWDGTNAQEITLTGAQYGVASFPASLNCVSNTSCIEFGSYRGGGSGTYLMQGDPATWDQANATQITGLNPFSFLEAGACPSPTYCVAIGFDFYNGNAIYLAGDPSTFDTAPAQGMGGNAYDLAAEFRSVSCPSTTFCVAVGQDFNSEPVVIAGDPATWSSGNAQEILVPRHSTGGLESVSCTSTTQCVAVGYDGNHRQPIVLSGDPSTWNETNMKQITMDVRLGWAGEFLSVSCSSSTFCAAVGYSGTSVFKPLVLRGNPATWTAKQAFNLGVTTAPSTAAGGYFFGGPAVKGYLVSVSCDGNAIKYCVAVGGDRNGAPVYMAGNPILWKGHLLSRPAAEDPSFLTAELTATSCTATKCFASGSANGGDFAASFDGG